MSAGQWGLAFVAQSGLAWLAWAMARSTVPAFRVMTEWEVVRRYFAAAGSGVIFGGLCVGALPELDAWIGGWLGVLVACSALAGIWAGVDGAERERRLARRMYGWEARSRV